MDLDALLYHYFGTPDLDAVSPAELAAGRDRLLFDFADERDSGRRFAIWTLMYVLDIAPDPDRAFEKRDEREAARAFMRAADSSGE
jgi:hypothetical protein